MKYLYVKEVFQEVPNEFSLAIGISECPFNCKNCHSPELRENKGNQLNKDSLNALLHIHRGISCVCFMGGDANVKELNKLAEYVKHSFNNIKVAWYSGNSVLSDELNIKYFDYIKYGPYVESLGPLTSKTTNQIFLQNIDNKLIDITYKFNNNENKN